MGQKDVEVHDEGRSLGEAEFQSHRDALPTLVFLCFILLLLLLQHRRASLQLKGKEKK